MPAEILQFPTGDAFDRKSLTVDVSWALNRAHDLRMTTVIVVGFLAGGETAVVTSISDPGDMLLLLERAKKEVLA